jgi:hypothetical protein
MNNKNERYAEVAAFGYISFVWLSAVPVAAGAWLICDFYNHLYPPPQLEVDRLEDMRDITLEQTAPAMAGASKSTNGHYQSLVRKDEVRLLLLHPANKEDEIIFQMEHVTLRTNDRRYKALSYVCGSDTAYRSIYSVEGRQILVTPNLFSALQHLRHRDRTRTLWIDALCIDQMDVDERSHQVQLMGDVYAKADRVVIWLGEECSRVSRAFSSLERVYANSWQPNVWHVTWGKEHDTLHLIKRYVTRSIERKAFECLINERNGEVSWYIDENNNLDVESIDWASIHALLLRPWFHRLWVIQEVSNAKRAIVLCGNAAISWNVMATSLTYLANNDLTKYFGPICGLACNSVMSIQHIRRRKLKDPLFNVALDHTHGLCGDSRDKLFALMSISAGRDIFDWEISFDYSLSIEELYKRFTLWDILKNDTFRAISGETSAPRDSELSLLPSWVPDWTRILDRHLLVRANDTSTFSAGLGKSKEIWFTHNKNLMHVEGAIIDSVCTIGSEPYSLKATSLHDINEITIIHLESLRAWLLECWDIAKAGQPMTKATYETFCRTMLCGLDREGSPAPNTYSEHFLAYFKLVRESHQAFREAIDDAASTVAYGLSNSEKPVTEAKYFDVFASPTLTSDAWKFHRWHSQAPRMNTLIEDSLQNWGKSKKFCRTHDGRLPRVPNHTAVDDVICILYRSEVPHVLRLQENGKYIVMGECYVHGVMHGEALAVHKPQILRIP